MASSIAAAAATMTRAATAVFRAIIEPWLRESIAACKALPLWERQPHAPSLRTQLRWAHYRCDARAHPRRRDLDRPRRADERGRAAGRALHRGQRPHAGRDVGDRALEPPLREERG